MANIERRVTAKGVKWRVRWHYGQRADGAKQSMTYDRQSDARALKREVEARGGCVYGNAPEVLSGSIIGVAQVGDHRANGPGLTFREAGERWLSGRRVKHKTRVVQRSALEKHLAAWHDLPVATITRDDGVALVDRLTALGVDARSPFNVAAAILNWCVSEGHLTVNPVKGVGPKKKRHMVGRFLTDDEVSGLLALASGETALMIRLASEGGLRLGEVATVQAGDLDAHNRLWVRRTATLVPGGQGVGTPKTENSVRQVLLPSDLADALRTYGRGRTWLFTGRNGEPIPLTTAQHRWRTILRRANAAGLLDGHARFHDLRHTYASRLLNAGVPLFKVSRLLGHGDVSITANVYGHLDPSTDAQVLAALEGSRGAARLRVVGD